MVNDLLDLTKEESITKLNIEKFDVYELIKNISNDYMEISDIHGKKFSYSFNGNNPFVVSDKCKLRQLLIIFIDNAFKYTNEGDNIDISVNNKESNCTISIKDSGIGIDEKDISLVFDRFFRSNAVRESGIDGSGIGLSIASMIVKSLKGNIKVYSKLNEGTEFNITIPKKLKNN
ncbi:sensor histidine kinase [Paraclostridium sp. AKS73]|nr:HAMP domain-containing sensor histidine kinase [Paraclostridium sp. AKS73]MCU9816683.1 HAMP domain-containing histidine kinase [Paraclostridium sp. AKS73]